MKKIFIVVILIGVIIFSLDFFDIFQIRFKTAKWESKNEKKIISNSIEETLNYFLDSSFNFKNKNKILVINAWSPNCGPCIKEIPLLNEVQKEFKSDTNIVFAAYCSDYSIEELNKLNLEEKKFAKFNFDFINSKKGLRTSLRTIVKRANSNLVIDTLNDGIPFTCILNSSKKVIYFKDEALVEDDKIEIKNLLKNNLIK